MRKSFLFLFFISLVTTACTTVNNSDLKHLQGYWEIASVEAHGEVFQPKGNAPTVDYYQMINDTIGYKKKMAPTFYEKYNSSEARIQYQLISKKGKYFLQFSSPLEKWEEEIKTLNATELVLFHSDKTYHYKRHQKITL